MTGGFWYEERHVKTAPSARRILCLVWPHLNPKSVIDVGCGVGTWLNISRELGASKIQGLEGSDLKPEQLKIKPEEFMRADLINPPVLVERFDLAITLEVAEHLPADSAGNFVDYLCSKADVVLFSAAPPEQGGEGHINEQWPSYWKILFQSKGYEQVDVLRSVIWDDETVLGWYRQNTMLYVKAAKANDLKQAILKANPVANDWRGHSFIHPALWSSSRRLRGLVRGVLELTGLKK